MRIHTAVRFMDKRGEPVTICGGCAEAIGSAAPAVGMGEGIGRRTFLAQSAILAAAAALVACGAGGDTTAPNITAGTTVNVNSFPALANVGGIALVTVSGAQLAVVRTGTANFVVLSRVCPHQGFIVNQNGSGFLCPGHGAMFSSTGQWMGGQPTSSLHSYANTFDSASGTLTIG
jgi:cytochrome b6-f complex iron-sulfur subunit